MTDKMQDPRKMYYYDTEYSTDNFEQSPALQKDMKPKPDCGEESYKGNGRLAGMNALITGADSGIGRAAAIAYAREGANVAIHYIPGEEPDAQEVLDIIKDCGVKASMFEGDFRQDGVISGIIQKVVDDFGSLDILVLNAAQQFAQKELADLSMEQVNDTFKVNIISMFEAAKEAEKHLKPGASIITTTSVQSFNPSTTLMDYAATKGAISNFTMNLSSYFAPKGIRVNGVAPGPFWTPLQLDGGQPKEDIPEFGQNADLGRAGQPVELAPIYVFLASAEASYVTGQIYGATGGQAIN